MRGGKDIIHYQTKPQLKDIAYQKIKEIIMSGEEEFTSESSLVNLLSMSRTPIRDAIHRLENEGFLKVYSNQGIYFWNPTAEERNELFDMRIAIETYSIKQVPVFTDENITYLRENIRDQYLAVEKEDYLVFNELDMDFHQYLLEVNGNSQFLKSYKNARERLMTIRSAKYLLKTQSEVIKRLIKDHAEIVDNLNKDSNVISAEILEKHINKGKINFS
ncbi:GntR family transcriptional regulator [Neobacillus niacini]|uniref:GntR family transcriptional regulator n=1 Tax=Neobacillus niacini TaxID=86668 RepID=UPI00203A9B91|nr:GntR family transcriptional regulator [Neobacillus niacini]MCM3691935.1 GntR family transcriptional regulator [Neobacillus niacini]